ncbi:MAG: hypothetical protein O1I87_15075 [Cylindrospermopsis raciborskii PAMP2012]|uniref:hypothetical protein n=2 Tax=Cylindrospermopsis raciborskii TaxID=77022 RepID=UPI000778EC95|nr:hypothetical protein [Cylindrospermopsis raciborskii]MCZ2203246.1 hypothetical protein [Cylindrospermopsis raciborskii PAMP2012]
MKTEYDKFHNHITAFKSVSAVTNRGNFTLQVLHGSDFECGIPALTDAIGFSAVVNKLKDDPKYKTNTLILSSGDNYISGPFFNASSDTRLNNMGYVIDENRSFPSGSYHPCYSYIVNNINNFVREQSLGYFPTPPVSLIVNSGKLNENLGEIIRVENFDVEYHKELFNNKESLKYFFNELEINCDQLNKLEIIESIIKDLPQFHPTVDNLIKFVNAYNSDWLPDKISGNADEVKSLYCSFMRKFYSYYPEDDSDDCEEF